MTHHIPTRAQARSRRRVGRVPLARGVGEYQEPEMSAALALLAVVRQLPRHELRRWLDLYPLAEPLLREELCRERRQQKAG